MKTSKQDIQDLLAQLAADIEEIKAMLNDNTAGTTTSTNIVADTGAAGNANAISNDAAANNSAATDFATATDDATTGNSSAASNPDRVIAEIKRLLEPIASVCSKLPDRIKSYYAQLLLRIPQDLREELTRDNNTRKCKGQPSVEDKIDNLMTMLISIYNRLNQIEYALQPSTPNNGQFGRKQSANGKSAKSVFIARFQSAWSWMRQFHSKRPKGWYRKPHILCIVIIYLLYFTLSIYSWQQWHHYRAENTHLRLATDKYRVDSILLRELYPQAAIILSAYEHITESEGAEAAMEAFRKNTKKISE